MRTPDFNNLLSVLNRQKPARHTLFEFYLNNSLYEKLLGRPYPHSGDFTDGGLFKAEAMVKAGYDYATAWGSQFRFKRNVKSHEASISLNDNATITDRESFDSYVWDEIDDYDYSSLEKIGEILPNSVKIMIAGPGGVLENVISLMGYDNLCITLYEDEQLVFDMFEQVATRLLRHYERALEYSEVGLLMSNDDWGFNTQTMLSPDDMRKYVFPWHKKIVQLAHAKGIPAVLHSCGNLEKVMDDIIDDIKYDGKHSYEDKILKVEDAYKQYGDRIAILGGIDVDFMARMDSESVYKRCKNMLDSAPSGYALGTGNSVPEFIPFENYFAMTRAVE